MKKTLINFMLLALTLASSHTLFAADYNVMGKTIDIHGFVSQGYLKSSDNNFLADTEDGTFEFNEYALNAYSEVTDKLSIAGQLFGKDLGNYGNNDIELDWMYFSYYFTDWFNFEAGKRKVQYGLYGETRDVDMLRTSILLPQATYNESFRDTTTAVEGAAIYGTFYTALGNFSYTLGYGGDVNIDEDSGITEYINSKLAVDMYDFEFGDTKNFALKWETPLDGLLFNFTSSSFTETGYAKTRPSPIWSYFSAVLSSKLGAPVNIEDFVIDLEIRSDIYSIEYSIQKFTFAFEYTLQNILKNNYYAANILPYDIKLDENPYDMEGFYFGVTYEINDSFAIAMCYSEYYPDNSDKDGESLNRLTGQPKSNAWLKDITVSTRYNLTNSWIFKLEGHLMDGTAIMSVADNLNEHGQNVVDDDWYMFAAKATYNF